MKGCSSKIHVVAFGLSIAVVAGLSMFLMGLLAAYLDVGVDVVMTYGSLYVGYEPSLIGSIIGLIYGLIDGFIFGVLIAYFYNLFMGCCGKCEKSDTDVMQ